MKSLWLVENNLLFQRDKPTVNEEQPLMWFSISHPLDELAPVVQCVKGNFSFVTDPNLEIVHSLSEYHLILTRNSQTSEHAIWQVKRAETKDYAHLYYIDSEGEIKVGGKPKFNDSVHRFRSLSIANTTRFDNFQNQHPDREIISLSPFEQSVRNLNRTDIHNLFSPLRHSKLDSHIQSLASFNSVKKKKLDPWQTATSLIFNAPENCEPIQEPILPQLTFNLIWTAGPSYGSKKISLPCRAFLAEDYLRQLFYCFLTEGPMSARLTCLSLQDGSACPTFDKEFSIDCRDAVYVPGSKLIVSLERQSDLICLYSGIHKICLLDHSPFNLVRPNECNSENLQYSSFSHNRPQVRFSWQEIVTNLGLMETAPSESEMTSLLIGNSSASPIVLAPCDSCANAFTIQNETQMDKAELFLPSDSSTWLVDKLFVFFDALLPSQISMRLHSAWYIHINGIGCKSTGDLCLPDVQGPSYNDRVFSSFLTFLLTQLQVNCPQMKTSPDDSFVTKRCRPQTEDASDSYFEDFEQMLCKNQSPKLSIEKPTKYRSDAILKYLPHFFMAMHLFYEENKLSQLNSIYCLKLINCFQHELAKNYLNLDKYCDYYEGEAVPVSNGFPLSADQMVWPSYFSKEAPLINLQSTCEQLFCTDSLPFYVYIAGVNDLSALILTLILAYKMPTLSSSRRSMREVEISNLWEQVVRQVPGKGSMALRKAFVVSVKSLFAKEMPTSSAAFVLAFLNELCDTGFPLKEIFSKQFILTLVPSICCLIHLLLISRPTEKLTLNTQFVNELLDCNDLLYQGNLVRAHQLIGWNSPSLLSHLDNIVQPCKSLRQIASSGTFRNKHWHLHALESHPVNRLQLQDDLRLREAYRLLQTGSHMPIASFQCVSNEPLEVNIQSVYLPYSVPFQRSPISSSTYLEAAQEMHYAATAVKASAKPIGRGMLFFGSLTSKNLPALLHYQPICLRGVTQSPQTGTHKHLDMAKLSGMCISAQVFPGSDMSVRTARVPPTTRRPPIDQYQYLPPDFLSFKSMEQQSTVSDDPKNASSLAAAVSITASAHFGSFRSIITGSPQSGLPLFPRDSQTISRAFHFDAAEQKYPSPLQKFDQTRALLGFHALRAITAAASSATLFSPKSPAYLSALQWPEFHNGVALGLSVSPKASIDSTWIMHNSNALHGDIAQTAAQAGMLLGLGLNGLLNHLAVFDIQQLLNTTNDLCNMAILLGLAVGKRGTQDQTLFRLLALYYRALLTAEDSSSGATDLPIPPLCEASAILGLGLLFQGSGHRHLVSLLVNELGHPLDHASCNNIGTPGSAATNTDSAAGTQASPEAQDVITGPGGSGGNFEPTVWKAKPFSGAAGPGGLTGKHREMISLTAGFSLGLLLLGKGAAEMGLSDMQVRERLGSRATGGQRPHNYVKTINVEVQLQEGTPQVNRDLSGLGSNNVPQTASSIQHQIALDQSRPLPMHLRAHMTTDVFSTLGRDNRYKKTQPATAATWDDSMSQRELSQECLLPCFVPVSSRLLRIAGNLLRGELTAYDLPLVKAFDSDRCATETVANTTTPMWLIEPSSSNLGLAADYSSSRQQVENSLLTESQDILPGNLSRLRHFNGESKKLHPRSKKIADSANIYSGRNFIPDVNGLGSLAAIGLVYMGVGSSHPIVGVIEPPRTLRALEEIRPDLLCLRQIALGLVKWHEFDSHLDPVSWLNTPITVVSDYVDQVQRKYNRLLNLYAQQNHKTSRLLQANHVTRLIEHSAPNSIFNIFIDCEMVATAHLTTLMSKAFVLGLRYAGTENEQVVAALRRLVDSLRNDSWWPAPQSNTQFPLRTKPSLKLLNDAIVTCILAISFILAGSCDVETLKLIKEVETLKLFNDPKLMAESLKRMQVPQTNESLILRSQNLDQANQNLVQNCFQKYAMAHYSALFSSARIALRDDIPVQLQQPTVSAALPGTPQMPFISLTGVMGTLLDPLTYGHYQILSSATGLLNLAAGKMTLFNSLEAAAVLFISFFPKFANSACDNVYHLQAFRHLYVLALRPRKLCAVDVDTNQVVPTNFHISLKNGQNYQSEPCLLLNNGISIEDINEVTLNFNSDEYWHRVFTCSDPHFDWFKTSFEEFGYMFVKRQKNDNLVDQVLQMAEPLLSSSYDTSSRSELRVLLRFLENFLQQSKDEKILSHLKTIICRLQASAMVSNYRNKSQH